MRFFQNTLAVAGGISISALIVLLVLALSTLITIVGLSPVIGLSLFLNS